MYLDDPRIIRKLQYRFKHDAIIYGIRCQVTNMLYVGSTLSSSLRFHKHLITGEQSNANLQAAIVKYGLGMFTVHIFKVVSIPMGATYNVEKDILLAYEKEYILAVPSQRLYNTNKYMADRAN